MSGLEGTGRLADDLYLMAHDEVSGRLLLSPRSVGLGLAGGLMAELLLAGSIQVSGSGLTVARPNPAGDELTRTVASLVLAEREYLTVRDWLAFLSRNSARKVADRLTWSGYLRCQRGWRGPRWVPVDPDCAFAPIARIRHALSPDQQVHGNGVVLAGLAVACGLNTRLVQYLPDHHYRRLDATVGQLPADLREVIAQTCAAVDRALLCHRS